MMAQMAATAGSVAVGSTIGHGLSNLLFGSSAETQAPPQQAQAPLQQAGISCDAQAKGKTSTCQISIHLTLLFFLRLHKVSWER